MSTQWLLPETTTKEDGTPRHVGVEIELQGIEIEALAQLTATTLGGEVSRVSSAEYDVEVAPHGSYRVEVDFALLKDLAREREANKDDALTSLGVDLLGGASAMLVPSEIVSPPIPVDEMPEPMDALVDALRLAGGKGTRQSLMYAFGVHLNIEPPAMDANTITRFLRAFVCLYDWIVDEGQVDLARQISPYIKPYGRDYDMLVADPDYSPDWPTLIDDYLTHNPTRDRALDMLPMFAEIDEERVLATVDDPLIKARPAFHYRLANSCVDEAGWSIAHPWNRWMTLERLAGSGERLDACAAAFIKDRPRALRSIDKRWVQKVKQWLVD